MSIQDTLKNIFSGLTNPRSDRYVGIDIGSSSIKIAQLKKDKGRIVLETYGEVALGPYQMNDAGEPGVAGQLTNLEIDKLTDALKNLIGQANVNAKQALISVSSSTSLIFILQVPPIGQRELGGVVQNEARKYIPVPLTEVSLDWWIIPEKEVYGEDEEIGAPKKKEIDVLVAAVRNEVVERYNTVSNSLGQFSSVAYEIETFSAIRGSFKHELAPVMLIDFGASGVRMSIIEHGVVRKFRAVNRGSAYLSSSLQKSLELEFEDAEKLKREVGLNKTHPNTEAYNIISTGVNYIFSEIQNVILDFEKEYRKPISKIILTGGGSAMPSFKEQIESKYNITTTFADPFSKALSPDFLEEVLRQAGPEFAVAVGLALQGLE
ncbi:type IV pilus assembly protein PilM [Patescibacteria group bacterium]|nr:type IV pilus assembly protein PilM [Patescibacteria group bacterium]